MPATSGMIGREMAYPAELERDVRLADGARVHIRPIRPDDESRLVRLYDRLSERSVYQRFFATKRRLPPDWARVLASVDYVERLALVATVDPGPEADTIAVARYAPAETPQVAEVAFAVEDGWQNRGLGTLLCRALLEAAEARGIRTFSAMV